jgi:hypothetical protein
MNAWTVRARRFGTVHIVRYWEVCKDGVAVDTFTDKAMAVALADYRNSRA